MIIKPKIRGFICTTAHPAGCEANVREQIAYVKSRGELKNGDLVFFRTQGRGTADHVGVYVGNGKFIQSPRSGQEIQITSLSEDYWQRHYVGARRVMTPKTIR